MASNGVDGIGWHGIASDGMGWHGRHGITSNGMALDGMGWHASWPIGNMLCAQTSSGH